MDTSAEETKPYILVDGSMPTVDTDTPGDPLGPSDFNKNLEPAFNFSSQRDPIEMAGLFQGDIQLTRWDNISEMTMIGERVGVLRNAVIDLDRRWNGGVIPYVISKTYSLNERSIVASAMNEFHTVTCIKFVPRTNEADYIHILKGDGCSSSVGRVGGAQAVSLGLGCLFVGVVMHEMMHATGFWHEQSRADRDEFIKIIWDNVQKGMEYNFKKYNWTEIQHLGVDYDPKSIMHYGPYAFAKDRQKPTIIPKTTDAIGQRSGFSILDTLKIRKLYECDGSKFVNTLVRMEDITEDECADYSPNCPKWATDKECVENSLWMKKNCRKSCSECGNQCGDRHELCPEWAKSSECTANPQYMLQFCKMSCGVCNIKDPSAVKDAQVHICEDKNIHCREWAKGGHCLINPSYMAALCERSCKSCV